MVEKMSSDLGQQSRASKNYQNRVQSISSYNQSDTAKEKDIRHEEQFKIKFDLGTVFLSVVSAGDLDETAALLDRGVDIDATNVDGLTALHQAAIDENEEMVTLLIKRGANIEARDNEGWTPLHAAASAGDVDIAKLLIENGADLSAVNNESEVPLDLVEEPKMEEYISDIIEERDLDIEEARNEEEALMMEHARSWYNSSKIDEVLDWQEASALHVAAAKDYTEVLSVLLKIPSIDVNIQDCDGWTPLHAAVHWESKGACELLMEAGGDFEIKNDNGQTPCDLSDPDFLKTAESFRKKSKDSNLAKKSKPSSYTFSIDKEKRAIEMLTTKTPIPILKGSKKETTKTETNNNTSSTNTTTSSSVATNDSSKKKLSKEEPEKNTKTSTTTTVGSRLNSRKEKTDSYTTSSSRENKREEPATPSLTRDLYKASDVSSTETATTTTSRPSWKSSKDTTDTAKTPAMTTATTTSSLYTDTSRSISSWREKRAAERNAPTAATATTTPLRSTRPASKTAADRPTNSNNRIVISTSSHSKQDWRTKIAERVANIDDQVQATSKPKETKSTTSTLRIAVGGQEKLDTSDDGTSSARRIQRRNLRENRRSTGVAYMPTEEDEDDSRKTEDTTARKPTGAAERLRLKNQEILSNSTDSRNERSSYSSDPIRNSYSRDSTRDSTRASDRTSRSSYGSTSSTGDTVDTKELQRQLDHANKDAQEYKQKYEKMKEEKDALEVKLRQYKEDVDKMQELKKDNLRLKDENGALIRVISKLSRTPTASS